MIVGIDRPYKLHLVPSSERRKLSELGVKKQALTARMEAVVGSIQTSADLRDSKGELAAVRRLQECCDRYLELLAPTEPGEAA